MRIRDRNRFARYRVEGSVRRTKKRKYARLTVSRRVALRAASASVAAFAVGICRLAFGGFYLYDLLGAVYATAVAALATVALVPLFGVDAASLPGGKGTLGKSLSSFTQIFVCFIIVLSVRSDVVLGMSAAGFAATFAVLYTSAHSGKAHTVAVAAVCGALIGWGYVPVYIVGALLASFFRGVSRGGSAACFCVTFGIASAIIGGYGDLVALFPAVVCAAAAFMLFLTLREKFSLAEERPTALQNAFVADAAEDSRGRLYSLSSAFSSVSSSFESAAKLQSIPSQYDVRNVCDGCFDEFCPSCGERATCWELEYTSTVNVINSLASSVRGGGRITEQSFPPYLRRRCGALGKISAEINRLCDELRARKTDSPAAERAAEYRSVADVLLRAAEENRTEFELDAKKCDEVGRVLAEHGIRYRSLFVGGARKSKIAVVGADLSRARIGVADLRRKLESAVGSRLAPPAFTSECGTAVLSLSSRRKYSVSFGGARSSPSGDDIRCGDCYFGVESRNDFFYAALCDGMGTGENASLASVLCSTFMRRMLGAGVRPETVLSMAGALLRTCVEEYSVGIDLLCIDLITGEASIYKSGGAPTYLKRDEKIYPIESRSAPIGILRESESVKNDLAISGGDVILLCSDGVDPDGGVLCKNSVWLLDILDGFRPSEDGYGKGAAEEEAARQTVSAARRAGSRDDVSAVLVSVRELSDDAL